MTEPRDDEFRSENEEQEDVEGHQFRGEPALGPLGHTDEDDDVEGHAASGPLGGPLGGPVGP